MICDYSKTNQLAQERKNYQFDSYIFSSKAHTKCTKILIQGLVLELLLLQLTFISYFQQFFKYVLIHDAETWCN